MNESRYRFNRLVLCLKVLSCPGDVFSVQQTTDGLSLSALPLLFQKHKKASHRAVWLWSAVSILIIDLAITWFPKTSVWSASPAEEVNKLPPRCKIFITHKCATLSLHTDASAEITNIKWIIRMGSLEQSNRDPLWFLLLGNNGISVARLTPRRLVLTGMLAKIKTEKHIFAFRKYSDVYALCREEQE